jgi:L-lactate utilization protein LutC
MNPRERFLHKVRQALAGEKETAPPERGEVGYQGAGDNPVSRFCTEFQAAGGLAHPVTTSEEAIGRLLELLRKAGASRVLLTRGPVVDELALEEQLSRAGFEVLTPDRYDRPPAFACDAGVTGVDYLVAETGSIVLRSGQGQPRSGSLLPPLHVAVAAAHQIVPDLFDIFDETPNNTVDTPACVSIITGPSKTGDIELKLVTGVHGPGEVHAIVIDPARPS